jgi:hypothetical protein
MIFSIVEFVGVKVDKKIDVYGLLFVVCCLLFVVYCLLFIVWCWNEITLMIGDNTNIGRRKSPTSKKIDVYGLVFGVWRWNEITLMIGDNTNIGRRKSPTS